MQRVLERSHHWRGRGHAQEGTWCAGVCSRVQVEARRRKRGGKRGEEGGRGHTMPAVYTIWRGRGGGLHKHLTPGRGRPKSHTHTCTTHAGPTHAHGHGTTTHTGHTSQRGYTWPHKTREAGGGSGTGAGGGRRIHRYERMGEHSYLHKEQHTALPHRGVARWEGQQAKVETPQKGNRKQYRLCAHTSKE